MEKFNTNEFYKQVKFPFYVGTNGAMSLETTVIDIINFCFQDTDPVRILLSDFENEETFEIGISGETIDMDIFNNIKPCEGNTIGNHLIFKASFPEKSITYGQLKNILEEANVDKFVIALESDDEDEKLTAFVFNGISTKFQLGDKKYLLSQHVLYLG